MTQILYYNKNSSNKDNKYADDESNNNIVKSVIIIIIIIITTIIIISIISIIIISIVVVIIIVVVVIIVMIMRNIVIIIVMSLFCHRKCCVAFIQVFSHMFAKSVGTVSCRDASAAQRNSAWCCDAVRQYEHLNGHLCWEAQDVQIVASDFRGHVLLRHLHQD